MVRYGVIRKDRNDHSKTDQVDKDRHKYYNERCSKKLFSFLIRRDLGCWVAVHF